MEGGIILLNNESILDSVKKDLGILPSYTHFDSTIIGDINSTFSVLHQLQVGPEDAPFSITGSSETWNEFTDNKALVLMARPYIFMKVRLMFDPPSNSFVVQSLEKQIAELEWRLNIAAECSTLGGAYKVEADNDE